MTERQGWMRAGSPVTVADVLDAARVFLGAQQRGTYIAWRTNRWYSDERLRADIAEQRFDVVYRPKGQRPLRAHPEDMFTFPTAQEVLLAGCRMEPQPLISSLDQLGVRWDTSPDTDVEHALGLVDRPEVFDPIRETGIRLADAARVVEVLSADLLRLMWQAGLSGGEITDASTTGEFPDVEALRVLAALRADRPIRVGYTGS